VSLAVIEHHARAAHQVSQTGVEQLPVIEKILVEPAFIIDHIGLVKIEDTPHVVA
jgi:hypothetical protein